jgi:hypothetical protein
MQNYRGCKFFQVEKLKDDHPYIKWEFMSSTRSKVFKKANYSCHYRGPGC